MLSRLPIPCHFALHPPNAATPHFTPTHPTSPLDAIHLIHPIVCSVAEFLAATRAVLLSASLLAVSLFAASLLSAVYCVSPGG